MACFVYALISAANKSETNPDASEQCIWLNNVKGLFPEPGKASEQNEKKTVMLGEHGSFHLSMEDDEFLAEQGILYNQIGTAAG